MVQIKSPTIFNPQKYVPCVGRCPKRRRCAFEVQRRIFLLRNAAAGSAGGLQGNAEESDPPTSLDPSVAQALQKVQEALAEAERTVEALHTLPSARLATAVRDDEFHHRHQFLGY